MPCFTPFPVKDKQGDEILVPCGKCPPCLARRASGWSFRLLQEAKVSTSAHFITLTYDTAHVPISRSGFMDLRKRDLQLFFKRLRKANLGASIKYYAVGEYGGKTWRPHYHIILFNASLDSVQLSWKDERGYIGDCHYGTVGPASVGYTLKYMCKPKRIPMHQNDDRQKEFALMSKDWACPILPKQCGHGIMLLSMIECIAISKMEKK